MLEWPQVKLSGDHCSAKSIELAEQTREMPHSEEMLFVQLKDRLHLPADATMLLLRNPELHLLAVHLCAQELLGAARH